MDPLVLRLLLAAKQQDLATLQQLHALIELVGQIADVVHQLQRERGLSNLVMYTPSTACPIPLREQINLVDQALEQTVMLITNMLCAGYRSAARLQTSLALALQSSDGLAEIRETVQRHLLEQEVSEKPCEQYSVLVRLWLDVVIEVAGLAVSAKISNSVLSLVYLLQAKEFAGQERAWGVIAFSGKAAGKALAERLQVLTQSQQDALQAFGSARRTAGGQPCWSDFTAEIEQKYTEFKQLMLGLCLHTQASPALAALWYHCASARIDAFHHMLVPVKADLATLLLHSKQHYNQEQYLLAQHQSARAVTADNLTAGRLNALKNPEQAALLNLLREQSLYISDIETELSHTRAAIDDLKIIQRAKLLLIAQHRCSEQQAHHQLQKLAMDRQQTLAEVAGQIVGMLAQYKKNSAKST